MTDWLPNGWGGTGIAIVVPARNEAQRLPRLLASLAAQSVAADILIVANGCSDATVAVARGWRGDLAGGVGVLDLPALPGGVGAARRFGMKVALSRLPAGAVLATTDADCVLPRDWVRHTLTALRDADVVCGRIVPDAAEIAALDPLVRRHGGLEDLLAVVRVAAATGAPLGLLHDQAPGASLAFRAAAYAAAGGFAAIPLAEDREIVGRMAALGFRVHRPGQVRAIASCRLVGRAAGGMASTIDWRSRHPEILRLEIAAFQEELAGRRPDLVQSPRCVPAA